MGKNIYTLTKEFQQLDEEIVLLEGIFSNISKTFDQALYGAQKFIKGVDPATVDRVNKKISNVLGADTNKLKTAFDIINRATKQRNDKLKSVVTQLKSEINNSQKIQPDQKNNFISYLDARLKAAIDIIEPLNKLQSAVLDPIDPLHTSQNNQTTSTPNTQTPQATTPQNTPAPQTNPQTPQTPQNTPTPQTNPQTTQNTQAPQTNQSPQTSQNTQGPQITPVNTPSSKPAAVKTSKKPTQKKPVSKKPQPKPKKKSNPPQNNKQPSDMDSQTSDAEHRGSDRENPEFEESYQTK
jgi:hypothetical protein